MKKDFVCIDAYCEKQGFEFHVNGHGRWGIHPYWSFDGVEYTPVDDRVRISSACGTFNGKVNSLDQFLAIISAMGIDTTSLYDADRKKENAKKNIERKMELVNRVAQQVEIKYGYRYDKCVHMAMQGRWWDEITRLSQMSNRILDEITTQVLEGIEDGTIE